MLDATRKRMNLSGSHTQIPSPRDPRISHPVSLSPSYVLRTIALAKSTNPLMNSQEQDTCIASKHLPKTCTVYLVVLAPLHKFFFTVLQKGQLNLHPLDCGLDLVSSFLQIKYRKGKTVIFQLRLLMGNYPEEVKCATSPEQEAFSSSSG